MSRNIWEDGSNNVIALIPSIKRAPSGDLPMTTEPVKSAVVRNLDVRPGRTIHWERDIGKYSHARDFFRVLSEQRWVNILCDGDSISKNSILSVRDADASDYELPVDYFMKLTADKPEAVSDIDSYVMVYFDNLGIKTGMRTNDASTSLAELSIEELGGYKPETKPAHIQETDWFYACQLMHSNSEPVWYGVANQFDCLGNRVTLLDIMLSCMDDAEINNFCIDWASMEVTLLEWDNTVVTLIPSNLLPQVVFGAIGRANMIYGNMPYEKARERYMRAVVIPKLKSYSDTDSDDQ